MPAKAKSSSSGLKELNLSLSKPELVKRLKVCTSPNFVESSQLWWCVVVGGGGGGGGGDGGG